MTLSVALYTTILAKYCSETQFILIHVSLFCELGIHYGMGSFLIQHGLSDDDDQ